MDYLNKIICGDCLEVMEGMPDGCIDLTITSPPYNIGNMHHTNTKRHNPYEDNMDEASYQRWQLQVLDEIYRLTKDGGSLLYNHKNRIRGGVSITPYTWLLKSLWYVKQELVWQNGTPNMDKIRFYPSTERIYWLAKSPDTKLQNILNATDVFKWCPVGTDGVHTRGFPVELPYDLIKCFPDAGVIFDPFIGSGTVAVAAVMLGRQYMGIDISPEYVALANHNLGVPVQLELF